MVEQASEAMREEAARYFARHLGAPVALGSLHQVFPGQSRETWLVEAVVGGERRGFVLRLDPPGGGIVPVPLRREYEVYLRLTGSEIPVATPLWFGEDPEWFGGRPHFVRDLVDGTSRVEGLREPGPVGEENRRRYALGHAEAMARLHALDWEAAGLGEVLDVPASPAAAARLEFDTWRAIWEEVRLEPFPVVTEALAWYEDHLPTSAPRVSLCKGNNGLGEEIWHDGRLVALSDWELASLGDPASDWAFSQGTLDLWDREQTLARYEEVAGFTLPRESLDFWTTWTLFKVMCCTRAGLRGFLDGRDRRAVLPATGLGMVKLAEQFLGLIVTLDLPQAAAIVAGMTRPQLDNPAFAG